MGIEGGTGKEVSMILFLNRGERYRGFPQRR